MTRNCRRRGRATRSIVAIAITAVLATCAPSAPRAPVTPPPLGPDDPSGTGRVLVFSRTTGFRHDSIVDGVAMLRATLPGWGIEPTFTEDPETFTDDGLAGYGAVIFLNTTGDVLDGPQQDAFERFIHAGKGYVGIHSATDTEYDWPFYSRLVGAHFRRHPLPIGARIKVDDPNELATAELPSSFAVFEEIYDFDRNPRHDPGTTVLLSLDEQISPCDLFGGELVGPGCEVTRAPGDWSMGSDHPIAWQREVEGGRAFSTNLGHMPDTWRRPEFVSHLVGGIRWALGEGDEDQAVVVADGLEQALRVEIAPDGDAYLIERGGNLDVVGAADGVRRTIGHLQVNTLLEQGLLGLALSPSFATDRRLFLYFVEGEETPTGRLASFTLTPGGMLDPSSRRDLLSVPQDGAGHAGGALAIGADGTLMLTTGDNTIPFQSGGYTPIDTRPGREEMNALRTSGNPADLRGKVLRVNTDGSIPAGNLFPGGVGGRPEILAMGFRNAFSIAAGDEPGEVYVGDVGPDALFDGDPGPRGFDELDRVAAPGDFGWPRCAGDRRAYRTKDFTTSAVGDPFDCSRTVRPVLEYDYLTVAHWALSDGGRTAIAGDVVDDADLAGPYAQPARFGGDVLMAEWSRGRLVAVEVAPDGRARRVERMFPEIAMSRPIDVDVAPDGSVYVLEFGFGATGRLLRIEHAAGGRSRPTVTLSADAVTGAAPRTATVRADAATTDRDDPVASVEWDVDADGRVDRTGSRLDVEFDAPGSRVVVAWARSASGRRSHPAALRLSAGNTPPSITLTQDPPGPVSTGQTVTYRASVTDAEDHGDLCAGVTWHVAIGHNTHQHPEDERSGGCELVSTVTLESTHAPGASLSWVVSASYTDRPVGPEPALTASAEIASQLGSPDGLPDDVRRVLDAVAANPDLTVAMRSVDWYRLAHDGFGGYVGGF